MPQVAEETSSPGLLVPRLYLRRDTSRGRSPAPGETVWPGRAPPSGLGRAVYMHTRAQASCLTLCLSIFQSLVPLWVLGTQHGAKQEEFLLV